MSEGTNGGRAEAFQALRDSEELHRVTLGRIWAEDHGGRGATFHMWLPPPASA